MSIESKAPFPISPQGIVLDLPNVIVTNGDPIVIQVDNQAIKNLIEQNNALRAEIRALKGIIKNMSG